MTPEQFARFLNYMKENNSWGMNMYELIHERKRRVYKYVDAVWDSRDNTIFSITLREGCGAEDKSFRVDTLEGIKALYDFIDNQVK